VTRARDRRRTERSRARATEPERPPPPPPAARGILTDVAIVLAAFAAASALAALLGAANFGTALSFGQIGFALALVYVLLRR
jgi:hypothetical protein